MNHISITSEAFDQGETTLTSQAAYTYLQQIIDMDGADAVIVAERKHGGVDITAQAMEGIMEALKSSGEPIE